MALSQIGSDLAKPLTSFLVRVSKSPLRNDMALPFPLALLITVLSLRDCDSLPLWFFFCFCFVLYFFCIFIKLFFLKLFFLSV